MGCLIELKFWRFHEIFFKQILKVSAFYLQKQKVIFYFFFSHCQYQNKKALFTDPIFSEGFGLDLHEVCKLYLIKPL